MFPILPGGPTLDDEVRELLQRYNGRLSPDFAAWKEELDALLVKYNATNNDFRVHTCLPKAKAEPEPDN